MGGTSISFDGESLERNPETCRIVEDSIPHGGHLTLRLPSALLYDGEVRQFLKIEECR